MAGSVNRKGGKKNRKIGRNSKKPSHKRYVLTGHSMTNAKKRQEKIAKQLARKAARKAKKAKEARS